MTLIETDTLTPEYEKDIWELLVMADTEFVPSLSSRNSTRQTTFCEDHSSLHPPVPQAYFDTIRTQHFIIAKEENTVIGFLSYIPDYTLPVFYNRKELIANYVSTIIVHPKFRGQKLTQKLYQKLEAHKISIATRTWSTNHAHIRILEKLDFEPIEIIENDRGAGIDTIYFYKKI